MNTLKYAFLIIVKLQQTNLFASRIKVVTVKDTLINAMHINAIVDQL